MKKALILILLLLPLSAFAGELQLKKNAAVELMFPMVDKTTPATFKSGETVTDTCYYRDGAGSWTALSITDTVTEISTSALYTIELTAAEMNHDLILCKFTATNSADTSIPIRTFTNNIDSTVTVGTNNDKTGYTASTVSDKTGYTATCSTVSDKTGYSLTQSFPTNFSALAIAASTGKVTVGTNDDKTGYTASTVSDKTGYTATCSTVSDKTGYSLTQSFPTNFSALAIAASTGKVTVGTNDDKTGYTASTVSDKTGYTATCSTVSDKTGYSLTQSFPTNFSSLSIDGTGKVTSTNPGTGASLVEIEGSSVLAKEATGAAIKTVTDKFLFDGSNFVKATAQNSLVVLPVLQGSAYTATATQKKEVSIVQKNTPRITFDLNANYTGWTCKFGAKVLPTDTVYIIGPKDCTWTDAAAGEGYVDLTSAETAASARLAAEIKLTNGDQALTAVKFTLKIDEAVIK